MRAKKNPGCWISGKLSDDLSLLVTVLGAVLGQYYQKEGAASYKEAEEKIVAFLAHEPYRDLTKTSAFVLEKREAR